MGVNNMFVSNMISAHGNDVPNQFVITNDNHDAYFQSYKSIIARRIATVASGDKLYHVELDVNKWNYSRTTSRYLALFLGVPNIEIKKKVASGEYPLVDLNSDPFRVDIQSEPQQQAESLAPLIRMAGSAGNLLKTY